MFQLNFAQQELDAPNISVFFSSALYLITTLQLKRRRRPSHAKAKSQLLCDDPGSGKAGIGR
jgi:hypothetical protein